MLSHQAFSVLCDYEARDAEARNEQLRKENESLEAAGRMHLNVQLTKNHEVLKEFNIMKETSSEEGDHLVYTFNDVDAFPHEEFRSLNVTMSGLTVPTPFFSFPSLTVSDDETVEAEIKFSNMISVCGILENFSGTIEQVKYMIRCNHTSLYFIHLGMVDALTGEPADDGTTYTNYLEGSTFLAKSIKIVKAAVEPSVEHLLENKEYIMESVETEEEYLQNLSKASMNHDGLRRVVQNHKALTTHNKMLKNSWDKLNFMAVNWLESAFYCYLDEGRRGTNPFNGVPEWVFEPHEDDATIRVSSIRHIEITIADNMYWDHSDTYRNERFTLDGALIFDLSPAATAILLPDESWNELDFENIDIFGYIRHKLTPRDSNTISNYQGPEPELTMRLVRLSIELSNIYNLLNALGIDYTSVDE